MFFSQYVSKFFFSLVKTFQTNLEISTIIPNYKKKGFGYTVVVDDDNTRQAVNLVQNQWTFPLFIDLLAMGITMVSAFTQGRPRHNYVIAGAIALTMASAIVEFLLFNSVQKVAPVLGSQASLGPGSFFRQSNLLHHFHPAS